jgi:hypothetical protein
LFSEVNIKGEAALISYVRHYFAYFVVMAFEIADCTVHNKSPLRRLCSIIERGEEKDNEGRSHPHHFDRLSAAPALSQRERGKPSRPKAVTIGVREKLNSPLTQKRTRHNAISFRRGANRHAD